ncbi:PREDICTED: hydroxycarboxylic acid receptor 3-like [Nanorana parkeri]|uniref:hydroxycarboxylic acid receptor 3-like n=1 Tax=Nanorana parkeri TaxID=125878 RepID=UPI0008540015|nr:PREDICTED: hydroxycarboxylic acid receptor 3-like [Nanorana parkeri]
MILDGLQSFHNQSNYTCCFFEDPLLSYILPPLLTIIFVLGSLFNGIALWAFCFHIKVWKSSTVYLFNLSVADFLLMICLPFRTDYYLKKKIWFYGDVPCRVMLFMFAMNRAGSIFFLTLVGLDRYFKVVYPHHRINSMSIKAAVVTACAVWLVAISLTAFLLTKDHTGGNVSRKAYCDSFIVCSAYSWWHDLLFIIEFFVPLCIVLFCSYSVIWKLRQRNMDRDLKIRKAVKCITLVGVVFCVCFLPSVSTRIEILRLKASLQGNSCSIYRTVETAFFITLCVTYMNSVCNPLVYYFSSPSMRTFYLQILIKFKICPKLSCPKSRVCF